MPHVSGHPWSPRHFFYALEFRDSKFFRKTHNYVILVAMDYHLNVTPKARSAAEREEVRASCKAC